MHLIAVLLILLALTSFKAAECCWTFWSWKGTVTYRKFIRV